MTEVDLRELPDDDRPDGDVEDEDEIEPTEVEPMKNPVRVADVGESVHD